MEIINFILNLIGLFKNFREKDELFTQKFNHYQDFVSLDNDFRTLDKCEPDDFNNTLLSIHNKCEKLKSEAECLFKDDIVKLENEIFEDMEHFKWECDDIENIKNQIYNRIVRTKYQECKKLIQKSLKTI